MRISFKVPLFLTCTALIYTLIHANDCDDGSSRGRPCDQQRFDDYEDIVIPEGQLDAGRGINSYEGDMNKKKRLKLSLSLWCEAIRPCPVYGGQSDASSNARTAAMAFNGGDAFWTSAPMTRAEISGGSAWVSFAFNGDARTVGSFQFTSQDNVVTTVVFEASQDGVTWRPKETKIKDGFFKLQQPPSAARHYRLRVTGTTWMEAGDAEGTISIGDFQMCLLDNFSSSADNKYVASPPFIRGSRYFASSRYSHGYREGFAFQGKATVWSSQYVYAKKRTGWLDTPEYIGYVFPKPRSVRKIAFMGTHQQSYIHDHPKVFKFQGSMDGNEWVDLLEASVGMFRSPEHEEEFKIKREKIKPFLHYRLYVLQTGWGAMGEEGGYLQLRHFRIC